MSNANPLLSLSGAQLRAEPTNPAFVAELARRMAKREAAGKVTVAALRSWGRTAEADTIVAHAKAVAPVKVAKVAPVAVAVPAVAKPKAVAFTRTNERVALVEGRIANVEASILALAANQASMKDVVDLIARKLMA